MPQRFIIGTDDPAKLTLYANHAGTQTLPLAGQVRDDRNLAFTLEPVTKNLPGASPVLLPDFDITDTFQVGIGIPDQIPTGGTFKLTVAGSTTNLTALAFDISAASLQTPFNVAMNAHVTPYPQATVTLVSAGVYRVVATSNGAIPTGTIVSDPTNLIPTCDVLINEVSLGSASTPYRLLIVVRQAPVAYAEPSTLLPSTGVTNTATQAVSATQNAINTITFDNVDPVSGSFLVSATALGVTQTCGVATWDMSADDFTTLLETHPSLTDNVSVTKTGSSFIVEFNGALGPHRILSSTIANPTVITTEQPHGLVTGQSVTHANTNSTPNTNGAQVVTVVDATSYSVPVNVTVAGTAGQSYFATSALLAVSDIDLAAPQGVSGTIDLNTENLYEYSLTQTSYTFPMEFMVRRTRASGEVSTIYGPASILISKDVLDEATLVPVPTPSYYTAVQSDARYGQLAAVNTWTDVNNFTSNVAVIGDLNVSGTSAFGGEAVCLAGFTLHYVSTAISYSAVSGDCVIGVTSTAAARTITILNAASVSQGRLMVVKDQSGAAATNNITVKSAGGTIDGVAAGTGVAIATNYGSLSFYSDGTNWFII